MSHATEPKTVKARQQHRCEWCYEAILPGNNYIKWAWFDGGQASTVKVHPECHDAIGDLYDDEFTPGEQMRGCTCCSSDSDKDLCDKCRARKERENAN